MVKVNQTGLTRKRNKEVSKHEDYRTHQETTGEWPRS